MEIIKYKTNIKNDAAVCRIASVLNHIVGSANWQLDIKSPDRFLTVYSPGLVNEHQLKDAIRKAGFKATSVEAFNTFF
jgi:hypothetical protein